MNSDCVIAVIYVGKKLWDRFIIQYDAISWKITYTADNISDTKFSCGDGLSFQENDNLPVIVNFADGKNKIKTFKVSVQLNGHALSYFVNLLKFLSLYRKLVVQYLINRQSNLHKSLDSPTIVLLKIHLIDVHQQIIDKSWNDRINKLVAEHCELDHAMSWLSTLGGAFSALGDYYLQCAQTAGQISLQQFKLALRLGDPNTVARCRLFAALSLMQTSHLKAARQIIWTQYQAIKNGVNGVAPDTRLIRMCNGCWAKLRYEYQQRRYRKRNPKALHWKNK